MIQLFGSHTSPYVRHCRIALKQANLPFEFMRTNVSDIGEMTPTRRVPFLKDGDLFLSDSTAIIYYVRQKMGFPFLTDPQMVNRYFMATTVLDTAINVFLLEHDGLVNSPYLDRQNERIEATFKSLNKEAEEWNGVFDDSWLRIGCLLDWVNFRERYIFSNLKHLCSFQEDIHQNPIFCSTAPTLS